MMKAFTKIGTCAVLVGAIFLGGSAAANAHGYIGNSKSDVTARAAMKSNTNLGPIQYEPQSVEGPKGFTLNPATGGPADGKIASGGDIRWSNLDAQSPARWVENEVRTGATISMGWEYTMNHATSEWRYYITKNGWDQNSPLTRDKLQLLSTVKHDGTQAPMGVAHKVQLPADHTGDHVILAVWDVADTTNAFYNTVDIHISGDGQPSDPKPEDPKPEDPNPEVPVGPDVIAPSVPANTHSMGTTQNSVDLMWGNSTDNVGVEHYEIHRAATGAGTFAQVGTSTTNTFLDKGLSASTSYDYRVIAVDAAGNKSAASRTATITTKAASVEDPTSNTWDPRAAYTKGDIVTHNGERYTAVQSYQGHGDPNWINALSLWKKL